MMSNLPTRLRKNKYIRSLVQETHLSLNDFVQPIFVTYSSIKTEINYMPGQFHIPLNGIELEIERIVKSGIKAILLFGIPEKKDEVGTDAFNNNGIIQKAVRKIKKYFPNLIIITDVCFCQYTNHGHCGIIETDGVINRKKSLMYLTKQVISHADSGVDFVAPSCMIDEMVLTIRRSLDNKNYENVGIISYSVKFSSSFYGPFRSAVNSVPKFGDRKSYQLNPGNTREPLLEAKLDEKEGADIIMIKPALSYLDIIHQVKNIIRCPIAAYQVSGEYSMIKATASKGWINENDCILESLTSIKRAGADLIFTYFATKLSKII